MSSWLPEHGLSFPQTRYMSAEVCVHGHLTTGQLEYEPERAARFCPRCGAETIRACPQCNAPIRGAYEQVGSVFNVRVPPNHCHNCGKAFPWTTAKLAAAKEFAAELHGLDETEKTQLQGAIEDLTGGPRTELAASRFKKLMGTAGQAVGSGLFWTSRQKRPRKRSSDRVTTLGSPRRLASDLTEDPLPEAHQSTRQYGPAHRVMLDDRPHRLAPKPPASARRAVLR
jgi:hypothetical protein